MIQVLLATAVAVLCEACAARRDLDQIYVPLKHGPNGSKCVPARLKSPVPPVTRASPKVELSRRISFRSISYRRFYRSRGAYPRFGACPDLPMPEAMVKSEMRRKA